MRSCGNRLELPVDDDPLSCFERFGLEIDDGNLFELIFSLFPRFSGVNDRLGLTDKSAEPTGRRSIKECLLECFGGGLTSSLNPQIKLLNTEGPAAARFCLLNVLEFGFCRKFAGRRKTPFTSHPGTYLAAKWLISGACGEMPLSKFWKMKESD